jgi:hypothetical protein
MNLQAKRNSGSQFTSDDILEVILDSSGADMAEVVHTVELISGPVITHGGGPAGEYLHYKSFEQDAVDGVIDYSNTLISVNQETQGTSVIKVLARTMTVENSTTFEALMDSWNEGPNDGTLTESPLVEDYYVVLESGEITIEWGEDTLV